MRRGISLFLVLCACAGTLFALAPVHRAGATPWGWSSSGDYATEEWGDPWDFSNPEDWDVQARLESPNLAAADVSGGTLNFTTASPQGGVLIGSAHYGDQSLHWGRSTWLRPIDAGVYSTVSFSMYSPFGDHAGGLTWFRCGATVPSCASSIPFLPQAGWHTYTFTLGPEQGWSGNIYSLMIVPNGMYAGSFQLDWVRVVRAGGSPTPLVEPVPVVLDPDRRGGVDYAAAVRGNAWDFDDGSDVADTTGIDSVSFTSGQMRACNTNNDPGIRLALGAPIDGSAFHRLSMRVFYDGGWGLGDVAGGGMVARLLWVNADAPDRYQVSEDIVVYPGWNDIDLDLATFPTNLVTEQDSGRTGSWYGHTITELRFDPHEDRGRRCFTVDDVALRADDAASPSFPIRFRDDAHGIGSPTPGTTAEIWLDTGIGAFGGTRIAAGVPVNAGENTFVWNGGGVAPGNYWVWVRLTDPSGRQSSAYAGGVLAYTGRPPLPAKTVTEVNTQVPGSASAVLANLTMTESPMSGYLTAGRCPLDPQAQRFSNGNFNPGQNIANLAVVEVSDARFCLFNESPVHLISDVQGRFASDGQLGLVRTDPTRVLDTRGGTMPASGSVTPVATGAPAGTQAVLVNLTMTEGPTGGFISAGRCSLATGDLARSSNGNFAAQRNIANLAVVPVDGDGRVCIYTENAVHLVVDVQGYFTPNGALGFSLRPGEPARVLDTRASGMPGPGSVTPVDTGAPAGTEAVLVNLTMTEGPTGGFISAGRCSLPAGELARSSNGNFNAGQNIANLAVVPVDADGRICLYNENPVHLIADVQGYFARDGALRFTAQNPVRVLDTRQG